MWACYRNNVALLCCRKRCICCAKVGTRNKHLWLMSVWYNYIQRYLKAPTAEVYAQVVLYCACAIIVTIFVQEICMCFDVVLTQKSECIPVGFCLVTCLWYFDTRSLVLIRRSTVLCVNATERAHVRSKVDTTFDKKNRRLFQECCSKTSWNLRFDEIYTPLAK